MSQLPPFAKALQKRSHRRRLYAPSTDSIRDSENDTGHQFESNPSLEFESSATKYENDLMEENEELHIVIIDLQNEIRDLKKKAIPDLQQQVEVERELNAKLSEQMRETESQLIEEKQKNHVLREQVIQMEQLLSGRQQITNATSSMIARLQEEYSTVSKDYQRILDLYNTVNSSLRQARVKISQLEADLSIAKVENERARNNNRLDKLPPPFPADVIPMDPFVLRSPSKLDKPFDDPLFGAGTLPDVGTEKYGIGPLSNDAFGRPLDGFNDPLGKTGGLGNDIPGDGFGPSTPLTPTPGFGYGTTTNIPKAALVDNIHFGTDQPVSDEVLNFNVAGIDKAALQTMLDSLVAERDELDRRLRQARKQGQSKSSFLREREELEDKCDIVTKKISKIKRELRK